VSSFVTGYLGSAIGLVLGTLRLPVVLAFSASPSAAGRISETTLRRLLGIALLVVAAAFAVDAAT
jgi:hypothetical protein